MKVSSIWRCGKSFWRRDWIALCMDWWNNWKVFFCFVFILLLDGKAAEDYNCWWWTHTGRELGFVVLLILFWVYRFFRFRCWEIGFSSFLGILCADPSEWWIYTGWNFKWDSINCIIIWIIKQLNLLYFSLPYLSLELPSCWNVILLFMFWLIKMASSLNICIKISFTKPTQSTWRNSQLICFNP